MPCCIYLRKSRADVESELQGAGETLARHRHTLLDLAHSQRLSIDEVYEEIVSGDSIVSRPQMSRLLADVSAGRWEGVLVMEVERLARGDTADQGWVAQAFKYSNTKIITPMRVYDPQNEMDEEYFEFSLYMARREYKTINRRMQAGRLASVREGNYMGTIAPLGYERVKRSGQKGWTLAPNESAAVVRQIFEWYTGTGCAQVGKSEIARRLTALGIAGVRGGPISANSVRQILHNVAYIGGVQWCQRQKKITLFNGQPIITRPRSPERHTVTYNSHEPIVSRELFNAAQSISHSRVNRPVNAGHALANPLAGLVVCKLCGHVMRQKPNAHGRPAQLCCVTLDCPNHGTYLHIVEDALIDAIRSWTIEYSADRSPGSHCHTGQSSTQCPGSAMPTRLQAQLNTVAMQRAHLYDLLEQGIYSVDVFAERAAVLDEREASIKRLLDECARPCQAAASVRIYDMLPPAREFLAAYNMAWDAAEKNSLLRAVISKVTYYKPRGCRRNENPARILELTIFPATSSRSS